jgi:putative ABC transport system ATP-binding protein
MGGEAILEVRDAGRVYRMGEVEVPALRDATLTIHRGEFLVIVGPSGSGKSTLLNLIGGMDRPTQGTVAFRGRDLTHAGDRQLTDYRRTAVGFVFQFYNLVPTLTALENVEVATEIATSPMDPREALRLVGLENRSGHFPSQLSGGEQQRVAIARALAKNPELLLCDEPTGALDLATSRQILALLMRLQSELEKTIILITHNNAITRVANRVAHIRDGMIVSVDTVEERARAEEVEW